MRCDHPYRADVAAAAATAAPPPPLLAVPAAAMAPRRQPASEKAMESIDPRTRFLYTPHTVTFLLLGAPPPVPPPCASAAAGQLGGAPLARHP